MDRPLVIAEREFFRFCVAYIQRNVEWTDKNPEVEISYEAGQLQFAVDGLVVHCPARGKLPGKITMQMRHMVKHLPKRFTSEGIHVEIHPRLGLLIGSHKLSGKWEPFPDGVRLARGH